MSAFAYSLRKAKAELCHERELLAIEMANLQSDDTLEREPFANVHLQTYYLAKRNLRIKQFQIKLDMINLDIGDIDRRILCDEMGANYRRREAAIAKATAEREKNPIAP